jgi:uncharacterized protein YggE
MTRAKALAPLMLLALPLGAQPVLPGNSLSELANTPVVRVMISEQLRTTPDEARLNVGRESRALTAREAARLNAQDMTQLLSAIRAAGIREADIQTGGISLRPDYRYETVNGAGRQRLAGYVASNRVTIKTGNVASIAALLDTLSAAGANQIDGPYFGIADPLPIRREARQRAMQRGETEAMEYARTAGFTRVRLLSVQEGISNRSSDIVITGSRLLVQQASAPPPPPPPPPPGGSIAPGQIESGVVLDLLYRMER